MKSFRLSYIHIVLIHCIIALVIFAVPFLSKILALLILIIGFYLVFKTKNKNNEVLLVAAYLVGIEVFFENDWWKS